MLIAGIKLTHDAALCVIEDNKLIFNIEMEKLHNNERHSSFCISFEEAKAILESYNIRFRDIDRIVIDGWGNWNTEFGKSANPYLAFDLGTGKFKIDVAGYGFLERRANVLLRKQFDNHQNQFQYSSYRHIAGHLAGSYCSSPFATRQENAFLLVWDGPVALQLFYWDTHKNSCKQVGIVVPLIGSIYALFASYFEPFREEKFSLMKQSAAAGKVMAYIALGALQQDLLMQFNQIYQAGIAKITTWTSGNIHTFTIRLVNKFVKIAVACRCSNEDILLTFHVFLEQLLVNNLKEVIGGLCSYTSPNLCYSGGCALNIKWNNAIRESGVFEEVWIPPFPNDSGSAIGTACCEMVTALKKTGLLWSVYSGPEIKADRPVKEWKACAGFSLDELAVLLFRSNEPVVFLNGPAETGPRALGARSILASPVSPLMKDLLNEIKDRESYRPVAPICLEADAPDVFNPGMRDPYMLFDHEVRPNWRNRVPAICHLDFTARVQTVNKTDNKIIFELLTAFKKISGIPLLCNTSANHKGRGFFPDVQSVMEWQKVNFIWAEGNLYYKNTEYAKQFITGEMMTA
jgi:carbamoyltransferase